MRHKGSVFGGLSLLITLRRRVKTRNLTSRTWQTTSVLETQQTVWTQSTPGKGKLGNNIPCCTQGYTYIHIYKCSSLNLLPPSPTLHQKAPWKSHTCLSKPWFETTWSLVQMDGHGQPARYQRRRERLVEGKRGSITLYKLLWGAELQHVMLQWQTRFV